VTTCRLYEQAAFREAVGDELRPGGLELTAELATACSLSPGGRVLDLGCGTGSTAAFLAREWQADVVGLDCSASRLAEARARKEAVIWVEGQAECIPCPDGFFDAVFAECVVNALADPTQALGEIHRVLRPGGLLAVSDLYLRRPVQGPDGIEPVRPASWMERIPESTCLRGALSREATVSRLSEAGFFVHTWRDRSHVLKEFVARMVFSYGSAARFWEALLGGGTPCREMVAQARPGYFLVVAERLPS